MSRTFCITAVVCALLWSGCGSEPAAVPNSAPRSASQSSPALQPRGQFSLLYGFSGHQDGGSPQSGLIAVNGVFYGTTWDGGDGTCKCGTVFSIDASGHLQTRYRFTGNDDGAYPLGGLVYVDGVFYGTTSRGGGTSYACSGQGEENGCGTVFAIDASGKERVVYAFPGGTDGYFPRGDLVALGGKLYGTTPDGGTKRCACGTVFAVDPGKGSGKTIYSFAEGKDGSFPMSGLASIGGTLYGTTTGGGNCDGKQCGTLFTVTPAGALHVVYGFKGSDGSYPWSNPIKVGATLYGTTYEGGIGCILDGCGTIYSIDSAGNERLIWLFGFSGDGVHPVGDLALEGGKIYGNTRVGGNSKCFRQDGCGTLFSFDPKTGREAPVVRFAADEASAPQGGVIAHAGIVYGTASAGGKNDSGAFYSFTP